MIRTLQCIKSVVGTSIVSVILLGCNVPNLLDDSDQTLDLPFEEISLPGVDRISTGGSFQVVVRTQEEYEQLIYERFQKRLNNYCNSWFPEIRQELEEQHPELSPDEIQELLNQKCIPRAPVLKGLDDVKHPEIDFSKHTLLGQDAHASGCRAPDFDISLTRDGRHEQHRFYVLITQYGFCEPALDRNLWILAPRIPETNEVVFEKDFVRSDI